MPTKTEKKFNCYKCKYRDGIAGSAHSCCRHPQAQSPLANLFGIMGVGYPRKLNIKANHHGIKKGWFMWPLNFDPVWLENCDGFESKK